MNLLIFVLEGADGADMAAAIRTASFYLARNAARNLTRPQPRHSANGPLKDLRDHRSDSRTA